jgi:hypothetical protein
MTAQSDSRQICMRSHKSTILKCTSPCHSRMENCVNKGEPGKNIYISSYTYMQNATAAAPPMQAPHPHTYTRDFTQLSYTDSSTHQSRAETCPYHRVCYSNHSSLSPTVPYRKPACSRSPPWASRARTHSRGPCRRR